MITTSSIVVASQNQVWCELEEEAAILNLQNALYYGLNGVGALTWRLIQTPITVCDVRDAILGEYDSTVKQCEKDLLALLQKLAAEGLIEVKRATVA